MIEQTLSGLTQISWLRITTQILLFFLLAWLVHRLSSWLADRALRLRSFAPRTDRPRAERQQTLKGLISSAISVLAFLVAGLATVSLFVDADTLVWLVGLFSVAFGWGARPLISDVLASIGFLFEDTFAVGEKVEILEIEGVIEAINLRTTWLRAPTGELYLIPNGEIRTVRNFSRGRFSLATITLKLAAADLPRALPLLEELGQEGVEILPNLLEPWQVLSESGVIGQHTELTLIAKARFGKAAEMRPRLLTLVQEKLSEAGIALAE